MRAVGFCSVSLAILLIAYPANAAAADRDLRLVEAVKRSDGSAVAMLLKNGADVNASEPDVRTALHWAAYRNDLETVSLLLRSGARVNAVTDLGITPLWVACSNGNTAIIARILDARADPNLAPETDGTPLMLAARTGNVEAVKLLLADVVEFPAWSAPAFITAVLAVVAALSLRSTRGDRRPPADGQVTGTSVTEFPLEFANHML